MKKNNETWSKRIWYVETLILFILVWTATLIGVITFVLMALSVIVVGITSICLKKSENKKLDVKPVLNSSNSFSLQLIDNTKQASHDEEKYHTLMNTLNVPDSIPSNIQQSSSTSTYLSSEQIEDEPHAKYVIFEGVRYRVRFKSLKLRNKLINKITDIQGLDKIWRLRKLDLSHNQIVSMKGIENLPNLRILKLSDNKIQKIEKIKNFQKLKKLTLDNNQLKEFYTLDLPNTLKHINIAKNPIEKFTIYTKATYKIIHFGPKKWFPKQELKRLKKKMRRLSKSYKSYSVNEGAQKGLIIFTIWAVITFLLALAINLAFWGVMSSNSILNIGYWECLFTQGLWAFLVGGFGAIIIMVYFYAEVF